MTLVTFNCPVLNEMSQLLYNGMEFSAFILSQDYNNIFGDSLKLISATEIFMDEVVFETLIYITLYLAPQLPSWLSDSSRSYSSKW